MAAYPLYFILGQEVWLGDLQEEWLTEEHDARWVGAEASIDMYDYQAAAVATYDTTVGSANSNTQDAADIDEIGMDVSLVRYLLDNDHTSGMAFSKRTDQGAIGGSGSNRWAKTHAESYANIDTAYDALTTLINGRGDSVDVRGFFLAFGYEEGVLADSATDSAFKTDLQQLILDLRTDYGSSTTPVVLDLPPASVSGFTASQNASLVNARKGIKEVAAADANVSYVSGDSLYRSNGSTKWYYTGTSTITQGEELAKEMSRLVSGKGTASGKGAPVYVLLGDDNCVGTTSTGYLSIDADTDYDDPLTVRTWNWATQTWEKLRGAANSNTSTDGAGTFGPDVSMAAALADQHPDHTVYLFKLGRLTSSLGNASATGGSWHKAHGDIYDEVETEWNTAKAAMVSVDGLIPDVRGLALIMGQEDVATQALADGYLGHLRAFMDDYRALFQTRVGEDLTIVLASMQDTGNYTEEYVETVQVANVLAADEDGQAAVVDLEGLNTSSDGLTLSGSGTVAAGKALAAAFATAVPA